MRDLTLYTVIQSQGWEYVDAHPALEIIFIIITL